MDQLASSLARLERAEIALRQDITHAQESLVRSVADVELELQALKAELIVLEQEMGRTVARAKLVVAQYRSVVKQGDMLRLQHRIDAWGPERRITRQQFVKMLG